MRFLLADLWWLLHPMAGRGYQFWSGIGSDISELTLVVGVGVFLHHHNCIEKGCWRMGHRDPEHGHPLCRRHGRCP